MSLPFFDNSAHVSIQACPPPSFPSRPGTSVSLNVSGWPFCLHSRHALATTRAQQQVYCLCLALRNDWADGPNVSLGMCGGGRSNCGFFVWHHCLPRKSLQFYKMTVDQRTHTHARKNIAQNNIRGCAAAVCDIHCVHTKIVWVLVCARVLQCVRVYLRVRARARTCVV